MSTPPRASTSPADKKNTPTGRPATERPGAPSPAPAMSQQPMAATPAPTPYTPPAANPYPTNQPYGSTHGPIGTPPAPQSAMGQQQDAPQRTVLGMAAPQLPNYANYRPSTQQPAVNPNVAPPQQQPYPSYPQQQQHYGGYPQQPNFTPPGQYMGYPGSGPMQMPPQMGAATPVDHMGNPINPMNMTGGMMPIGIEGKKSTLARDIAIGVGIAALVLVGFLVVKMVVLDKGDSTAKDTTATSKLANVKIKMPAGMTAEMTVDGARVATVENGKEIAVSAGMKHIKLVGNNGLSCDDDRVKLESGKTTLLECGFGGGATATGSGSAAAGSAAVGAGSAAPVTETKAQGSAAVAAVAAGSGAGSGSAAIVATKTETKPAETKAVETKTETKVTTNPTATKTETKSSGNTTKTESTKTDTKNDTKTETKSTGTQTSKTEPKSGGSTSTKADSTKGYLQVYSKPTAHILVDGQETNLKTPISGHALPLTAGKHKITFVIGDDRFTYPVMVKAGATETMSKDLQ
jgi:hypothetical protein